MAQRRERGSGSRLPHLEWIEQILERFPGSSRAARNANRSQFAVYDALTGIPNRTLLREMLTRGLASSATHRSSAVVAALDIDNFKRINGSLGLDFGDRLLIAVARRITGVLGPFDSVARSSGDEFIILRADTLDPRAPVELAQALSSIFEAPFQIDGREIYVRASIGMSIFPNDGEDARELLASADAALVRAKHYRRGGVQFYDRSLQRSAAEPIDLESDLRRAIDKKQFELHYQPIIRVENGAIAGAEALLRWRHPKRGLVLPSAFIGVCEESGLIEPIGRWVLRSACRQAKQWCEQRPGFFVSVNVSARQLDHEFHKTLQAALDETSIDPCCIELEFTESAVIREGQIGLSEMRRLRELGVHVAIDDFGTGYSSLAYLKRLPVDSIKIDRLFVNDVAVSPYDSAIARAIVSLAKIIDLRVVAEGVETAEQRDLLANLGCDLMQGYLFGRPVPPDALFNAAAGA